MESQGRVVLAHTVMHEGAYTATCEPRLESMQTNLKTKLGNTCKWDFLLTTLE